MDTIIVSRPNARGQIPFNLKCCLIVDLLIYPADHIHLSHFSDDILLLNSALVPKVIVSVLWWFLQNINLPIQWPDTFLQLNVHTISRSYPTVHRSS